MQKSMLFKLLAIGGISFVILIALQLVEGQIHARSHLQESVLQDLAQSAAGQQTLIGPVLLIQYKQEREIPQFDAKGKPIKPKKELFKQWFFVPADKLATHGEAQVETRKRGIYSGQLYHLDLMLEGSAEIPQGLKAANGKPMIEPEALLVMSVSDLRGVDNVPEATLDGKTRHRFDTAPGRLPIDREMAGSLMYAELGRIDMDKPRKLDFSIPLKLTGTQTLAIAPVAGENTVELKSDWPHPSFGGRFLPRRHEIDNKGFAAGWKISNLNRNFDRAIKAEGEHLAVTLKDPVNVYSLSIRAIKYGILFVVLTFGAFFVTETLKRSPIHPVQYLLVGLALAIFFLLLIALSEHVAFAVAYLSSAAACIALITYYLSGALGGWGKGLSFGAGLTGLYGVIFGILHSEDNALLIGAILLFVALGGVMLGTRRFDWYRTGNAQKGKA